ncbi:hypothetical protein [uncultured Selenomonas sp.]|nr:hypothetical protein [uncultured Selenomonas sp.]
MAAEAEAEIKAEAAAVMAEEARAEGGAEAGEAAEGEEPEAQEPADEEGGFEPLAADDLQHMDTAEEEEETRAS